MNTLKRLSARIGIGLVLLSLFVCSQAPEDGGYYLDPDKYEGIWTREDGTQLEKLILEEDTWIYVKGDEILYFFTYYQGGKGTFDITETAINLKLEKIYACPTTETCGWYVKGSNTWGERVVSEQKSVPYSLTDTTLTVDLGSGPQDFTKQ